MNASEFIEAETGGRTPAPVAKAQELRKYLGVDGTHEWSAREPVRWDQHLAWTIHAERSADPRTPPPFYTPDDLSRLIVSGRKIVPSEN